MSEPADLPPVPTFAAEEQVCGNCKLWQPHSIDARGWVGPCRLQPNRGLFPPSAPLCNYFAPRGQSNVVIAEKHRQAARAPLRSVAPVIVKKRQANPDQEVDLGEGLNMTRQELIEIFREAVGDGDVPPLATKWEGGVIQLVPGKSDLQGKEIPIDAFFHKIVMVRDRLRTLEQKINAHPKLTDAEKVEIQNYVTRIYGSLTSFNVLFREKGDQFVGMKGEE